MTSQRCWSRSDWRWEMRLASQQQQHWQDDLSRSRDKLAVPRLNNQTSIYSAGLNCDIAPIFLFIYAVYLFVGFYQFSILFVWYNAELVVFCCGCEEVDNADYVRCALYLYMQWIRFASRDLFIYLFYCHHLHYVEKLHCTANYFHIYTTFAASYL